MSWINVSKGTNYDVVGSILRNSVANNYRVINIVDTGNERNLVLC